MKKINLTFTTDIELIVYETLRDFCNPEFNKAFHWKKTDHWLQSVHNSNVQWIKEFEKEGYQVELPPFFHQVTMALMRGYNLQIPIYHNETDIRAGVFTLDYFIDALTHALKHYPTIFINVCNGTCSSLEREIYILWVLSNGNCWDVNASAFIQEAREKEEDNG